MVGSLVVEHDRVARRVCAVFDWKSCPQRTGINRPQQQISRLVVNREHEVDHLHVIIRTNIAVRVGRVYPAAEMLKLSWFDIPSNVSNGAGMVGVRLNS